MLLGRDDGTAQAGHAGRQPLRVQLVGASRRDVHARNEDISVKPKDSRLHMHPDSLNSRLQLPQADRALQAGMHKPACALPCFARICKWKAKLAVSLENFRVLAPSFCEEGQIVGADVVCCLMHVKLALAEAVDIPENLQSWLAAPSRMGGR